MSAAARAAASMTSFLTSTEPVTMAMAAIPVAMTAGSSQPGAPVPAPATSQAA